LALENKDVVFKYNKKIKMKATRKSSEGTSFFNHTIQASVSDLRQILGLPVYDKNDGEDKVNFEWVMETKDGDVFTVYDWKEYRELKETDIVGWHIGGHNAQVTAQANEELELYISFK
jgi:hypothetical protein